METQKPIEIDASFLYICPNRGCSSKYWLFLREVQTKNFKIVCDCGMVFKPKTVDHIKISYKKKQKPKTKQSIPPTVPKVEPKTINSLPVDILEQCATILDGYGFSRTETIKLVTKAYHSVEDKSVINIIKVALRSLEIQNV
jgi:hypothetical protein